MQLINALLVLPMRVISALILHGIARECDFAIWSLSLACLISEQPPRCMGTRWSVQLLWFLLLLLKSSCIPKYDQHQLPSSAIFWNTFLCTALPCCSPLLPESGRDFWLCFMQWCCKQGGCAGLDQLHTQKPCSQGVPVLLSTHWYGRIPGYLSYLIARH